jgi:hypothetical protein
MVEQHLPSRAGQYSWVDRVTLAVCSGSKSDTARKTFSYQCRGRPLRANRGHSFSGHSLKDFEAILDAHYLGRDVQLAEGRQSAISINTGW